MMGRPSAMAQNWPMNNGLGNFSQPARFCGIWDRAEIYFAPMQDRVQRQILNAFFAVLRPVARILLQFGIGFREFSEVAKSAFVDVATSDFGLRGRPTNISRVAVMTGLTRKEVRRVRDRLSVGDYGIEVKSTPLAEVLHRWHSEPDFLDSSGRPKPLQFSDSDCSFTELVRRFGGDIPPGAMRTELKRVGAIAEELSGELRVLRREISAAGTHDKLITALAHTVFPLLANVCHNLNPDRNDPPWPQLTAHSQLISSPDLPRIRRISTERLGQTAEAFDDLFIAFEPNDIVKSNDEITTTVAIGVFYFESTNEDERFSW